MGKGSKASKGSSASKKKTSIPSLGGSNFGPVNFETSNAATAVHLLQSTEEDLVLKTLLHVTQHSDVIESFLEVLCENGIYPKLVGLLISENIAVLRLTLRLLVNILTKTKFTELILIDEAKVVSERLINIYVTKNDEILTEYASSLLVKVIGLYDEIVPYIYDKKLIEMLFLHLKIKTDPDIQLNSIELVNSLIDSTEHIADMLTVSTFQANIFICYLKSSFREIQQATMSLVKRICQFRYEPLQNHMVHNKVPESLVQMMVHDDFLRIRQDILETLILLMETLDNCTFFSDSMEFAMMVGWAKLCPEEFIDTYTVLLKNFTRFETGIWRQKLHYYGVEDAVLTLFRTNRKVALLEACICVINLSNHKFGCDRMVTPMTICRIIFILNSRNFEMVPYIEVAVNTVHLLLKRNGRMLDLFYKQKGLEPISEMFVKSQEEMTDEGYSNVIDIVELYAAHPHYRGDVLTRDVYETFFMLYKLRGDDFAVKAAYILNEFMTERRCREYFLELQGPKVVVDKLLLSAQQTTDAVFKNTLILVKTAIIYKTIARTFMLNGLIPAMRKYQSEYIAARLIIDMISGLHLPFKFFEKKRLEITDVIRDNFYLITGNWAETFPFLEQLETSQISTKLTIYVVDYSYLKKVKELDDANSGVCSTISTNTVVPIMTKFSNMNVNYGGLTEDPYLYLYVQELRGKLEKAESLIAKIEIVAIFVQQQLCGTEEDDPVRRQHIFQTHLSFLKNRLGTNMIPIGFMRQGKQCERALLFKVCGDYFELPVTLVKGEVHDVYWNEVVFAKNDESTNEGNCLLYYVVDLMRFPGKLYLTGDYMASRYCTGDLNLI